MDNDFFLQKRKLKYLMILSTYLFFIVICYKDTFSLGFLQDDGSIIINSFNWKHIYLDISNQLQYRPNFYFIVNLILKVFGSNVLIFRICSMVMHATNALLICILSYKIFRNSYAAFISGVLYALHCVITTAIMLVGVTFQTGLGVMFFLLSCIFAYNACYNTGKTKSVDMVASLIFNVLGILSYEAAIITVGIVGLIYFTQDNERQVVKKFLITIKCVIPNILISFIYLLLRMKGIQSVGEGNNAYAILFNENIIVNLKYYFSSFYNFGKFGLTIFIVVMILSLFFITIKKDYRFIVPIAILFAGIMPFMTVDGNGRTAHYIMYSLVGANILLCNIFYILIERCIKNKKYILILTLILTLLISANATYRYWNSFENNGYNKMSETGKKIAYDFNKICKSYPNNADIYLLNFNESMCHSISFGDTLNLNYLNNPYKFNIASFEDYYTIITKGNLFFDLKDIEKTKSINSFYIYADRDFNLDYDKNLTLYDVTDFVKEHNFSTKTETEILDEIKENIKFREFKQSKQKLEGDIGKVTYLDADQLNKLEDLKSKYVLVCINKYLNKSKLLVREKNDWDIATYDNISFELKEAGAYNQDGKFLGLKLEYNEKKWRVSSSNDLSEYTIFNINSFESVDDIPIGISEGAKYTISLNKDKSDEFIRIKSVNPGDWMMVLDNSINLVPQETPLTIFIKMRKPNDNEDLRVSIYDFKDQSKYILFQDYASKVDMWNNMYFQFNTTGDSQRDYFSAGIYGQKSQMYFDVKEFIVLKGIFFREMFE